MINRIYLFITFHCNCVQQFKHQVHAMSSYCLIMNLTKNSRAQGSCQKNYIYFIIINFINGCAVNIKKIKSEYNIFAFNIL